MTTVELIFEPTPKQREATVARQRWTLLGGGEGGGKTRWLVEIAIRLMIRNPGIEGIIGRFNYADVTEPTQVWDVFRRWCPLELVVEDYRSAPPWIRFRNGSRVTFMGLRDYHPSAEYGFACVDQAEEVPEDTLRLLNGRLRQRLPDGRFPRYRMLLTCNPHPRMEWFIRETMQQPDDFSFVPALWNDNPYLPPDFISQRLKSYTRRQRQRLLEGLWVVEIEGALWRAEWIEDNRVQEFPELQRVVVAVDPAVTALAASDETGVVVAGLGTDAEYYVLHSIGYRLSPQAWASHAIDLYDTWHADRIIAEANQGGDMVEATIRQVRRDVPVTIIKASRGKTLRAEPIAALYEQGHVHHWQEHEELEDQMLTFPIANEHDDLVDALVYALTELMGNVVEYDNGGFSDGGRYQIGL